MQTESNESEKQEAEKDGMNGVWFLWLLVLWIVALSPLALFLFNVLLEMNGQFSLTMTYRTLYWTLTAGFFVPWIVIYFSRRKHSISTLFAVLLWLLNLGIAFAAYQVVIGYYA